MKASIEIDSIRYSIDLEKPIDISRRIRNGSLNPKCFWAPDTRFEPVTFENFVGSIKEGGSVNFKNIFINPHGSSTHTECVGHIAKEEIQLADCLTQFFYKAQVISIYPEKKENGDLVITKQQVSDALISANNKAVIIRCLPNDETKINRNYSDTNPPYFEYEAIEYLVGKGIDHLLTDLPSVDREVDGAAFKSHKALWNYPENTARHRTITEMVYVPNIVLDGHYFLNIQCLNIELDVSPSRPVLYRIED